MAGQRVKLWDWPVRVIHWGLVLLMLALWWTADHGQLALHKWFGYQALGLLTFRVYWGFFGSSTARFSHFLKGPRTVFAYLRGMVSKHAEPVAGHNPLGGWSVAILLLLLISEVKLGLFALDTDEGLQSGPLAYFVSDTTAELASHWHRLVFNILLGFIALHIAAVLFYLFIKRENLIGPMLSGRREMAAPLVAPRFAPAWRILAGLLVAMGLMWWVSAGAPLHLPTKH